MRWLALCVTSVMWVVAAPLEMRCASDYDCVDGATHNLPQLGFARTFMVEDYRIEIYYKAYDGLFEFHLNCHGRHALDRSLPRFESLFRVHTVVLEACPPPMGQRSFRDVLAEINISLEKVALYDKISLKLVHLPSKPILKESHFAGLEHLTNLTINNHMKVEHPKPKTTFLWPLLRLSQLELKDIRIPFNTTENTIVDKTPVSSLEAEGSDLVKTLYSKYQFSSRRRRASRSIAALESDDEGNHNRQQRHDTRSTRR